MILKEFRGIGVVGWCHKNVSKGGRFRAAFFLCRQTLLSYRTSESSFFSIQGEGVRGVPGGPRGAPGGSPGGRGVPGEAVWRRGPPRDPGGPPRGAPGGSPGGSPGGVPGGVPGVRNRSKILRVEKHHRLVKISSGEILWMMVLTEFYD
jgi:hypothetical protein